MKKIKTILSVTVMVPMFLAVTFHEGRAEQKKEGAPPAIKEFESRSSEWGKHYPKQYETYMQTQKSDEIFDALKKDPALVIMWAGYPFSKDYNKPRGHYYALEDVTNTLRTGAPVDAKTGPLPTACWSCKSPDVPRLVKRDGEMEYFTGKWAKYQQLPISRQALLLRGMKESVFVNFLAQSRDSTSGWPRHVETSAF